MIHRFRQLFAGPPAPSGRCVRFESLEGRLLLAADPLSTGPLLDPSLDQEVSEPALPPSVGMEGEDSPAADLVAFAQDLATAGVKYFGAAWCPACTAQKEAFEDGQDFLPFIEVTNPDRTLNSIGINENISAFPTWEFPDGSRLEGVQTLETLSQRAGVAIPQSNEPRILSIEDKTIFGGSAFHQAIDGYDPNGNALTFTVSSSNPALVDARVLTGNRSALIDVNGFGKMTFQIAEQRAGRSAERFIELVEADFYDSASHAGGMTFHRVVEDFVIQFGDPAGTGGGGSTLPDFDDQFHVELQQNDAGVLAWAKAGDDTNNSQLYITERAVRHLDGNHGVAGFQIEGQKNREAINSTAVTSSRPNIPVTINEITLFEDTENGLVVLTSPEGASGEAEITVTATNSEGRQFVETFMVTVAPDPFNTGPWLEDIPTIPTAVNTPAQFTLTAVDVENDPVSFSVVRRGTVGYDFDVNSSTGEVTVTPPQDFIGQMEILARVRAATSSDTGDTFDDQVVTIAVAPGTATSVDLQPESDSGARSDDNVTNAAETRFLVSGVSDGAIVRLRTGNTILGQTTASGSTATIATSSLTPLGDGTYNVFATQLVNGVESEASTGLDVIIDTTPPAAFTTNPPTSAVAGQQLVYNAESGEEGNFGITYALVGGPNGATIDSQAGILLWTPASNQVGTQDFSIVVSDTAGNSTAQQLSINVTDTSLIEVSLQVTDLAGNPISTAEVGDDFLVQALVEDLRVFPEGVFAFYLDVLYDAQKVGVTGPIVYGAEFPNVQSGSTDVPGILNEVGGTAGFSPIGEGRFELFSVPMRATFGGPVTFVADRPDNLPSNEPLVFGISEGIPLDEVSFQDVTLNISIPFGANDDLFNIDEDSAATTLDVLQNDDTDGSQIELTISSTGPTSNGGTVTIAADGKSVAYTPAADFFGDDEFTYTIGDGVSGSDMATVTVQVHPLNDPPTANDDEFSLEEDSVDFFLDPLANDEIQPDAGEQLRITQVGATSSGGTVTIGPGSSHLLYTPPADFTGTDTFSYTIEDNDPNDPLTDSATITVTVTEINDPPTATDDRFTILEDSPQQTFDVLSNDDTNDPTETIRVIDVIPGDQGGTVAITADETGLLYTPAANFNGIEILTYTIDDGKGGQASANVLVTVNGVNDPPTATDDTLRMTKNTTVTIDVLSNDSDAPDDKETLTITAFTQGSQGGTVELDGDSSQFRFTPTTDFTGEETFTYDLSDGELTSTATVRITVDEFRPSNLRGYVFLDRDRDGVRELNESPVIGNLIELAGVDDFGNDVLLTAVTQPDGSYAFDQLAPGNYRVTQLSQPQFLLDGPEMVGTAGGQSGTDFFTIDLGENVTAEDYNFTELGRQPIYGGLLDFLASTPVAALLVALDDDGNTAWSSLSNNWNGFSSADVTVNHGDSTLDITAVNSEPDTLTASVPLTDLRYVQPLGTNENLTLYRISGSTDSLSFTPSSSNAEGEAAPRGTTSSLEGWLELDGVAPQTAAVNGQPSLLRTPVDPAPTDAVLAGLPAEPLISAMLASSLTSDREDFLPTLDELLADDAN